METLEMRDETVTVKQFRKNGWLPEGHDGELRYTHCFAQLVPKNDKTGYPVTGLTPEDEAFFESKLKLASGTLTRYNLDYWGDFRIDIPKEGLSLDLNNPYNLLVYKVLCADPEVANSEAEKHDSPFAQYVITSDQQEAKANSIKVNLKRKAWGEFSNMSSEEMANFLKVYGKRPAPNATSEWLESEVGKLIETNPELFLAIKNDENFKMKTFIDDCLVKKALIKSGTKYSLTGGDIIGYSLENVIEYLSKPENQEVYIQLKSRLDV